MTVRHSFTARELRAFTLKRALIGAAAAVAALLVTLPLRPLLTQTQVPLFYAAVATAAYAAGLSGATLTIVLSLVLSELFLFNSAASSVAVVLVRDGLFLVISFGIAILTDRLQAARTRAELRTQEIERLAAELRQQASEMEVQVTESAALAIELEETNAEAAAQSEAARRAAERAARLQRFTSTLLNHIGAAAVARTIVVDGRRAIDASGAVIAAPADDGGLDIIATDGYRDEQIVSGDVLRGPTPLGDAIRTGEPVFISDPQMFARRYPELAATTLPLRGALAALPLAVEKRRIGALGFTFSESGEFLPEDRSFMQLVAQQCAQALERARLHDMELRARVRAEFAERRLAFLADASGRLAASLDYLATLANVSHLAVPEIADWCLVHLIDDNGVARLIAAVHTDPDQVAQRRALEARYSASSHATRGYAHVLRTGEPEFVDVVKDEHLRAAATDDEHLEALRAFRLRSQMVVPIKVEENVVGAITLATAESGRTFSNSDLRLALELARRAGQAVENARLYQAAHHASEAKSDFLAVMSHELRTPLNAIIGYSDLMLLGVPDEVPSRARRQVERIRGASTSLLQLVEEVLSFSRIEAGKEEIRISPVDLTAVVRDCVAMVEPLAAEKGLAISIAVPDSPLKLVSDERKIRQILTNLLSNAVKFTEHGGIGVTLQNGDGEAFIEVADTGIGIDPQHLDRIFDPFWQVEQSATRRFGGTGLGLGVARKLARLLEGRLEVDSHVGKGSTFTLFLPLRTPGMSKSS